MKFNLHKLGKAALVGVASLALIVPLGMGNDNTANAMSRTERRYYLNALEDPSDYIMTKQEELELLCKHPSLRNTYQGDDAIGDPYSWDGNAYDYYAHHFKQLYTPWLYPDMPKKITKSETDSYRRDEYLLHKDQEQLGLLGHHRSRRHVRRQTHRRIHRNIRHHQRNRRRNHRSRRNRRHRSRR